MARVEIRIDVGDASMARVFKRNDHSFCMMARPAEAGVYRMEPGYELLSILDELKKLRSV